MCAKFLQNIAISNEMDTLLIVFTTNKICKKGRGTTILNRFRALLPEIASVITIAQAMFDVIQLLR